MYTTEYTQHLEKMKLAQVSFDLNPCKKTATILSNLREKRVNMYTPEEMAKRKTESQKRYEANITELWELIKDTRQF